MFYFALKRGDFFQDYIYHFYAAEKEQKRLALDACVQVKNTWEEETIPDKGKLRIITRVIENLQKRLQLTSETPSTAQPQRTDKIKPWTDEIVLYSPKEQFSNGLPTPTCGLGDTFVVLKQLECFPVQKGIPLSMFDLKISKMTELFKLDIDEIEHSRMVHSHALA